MGFRFESEVEHEKFLVKDIIYDVITEVEYDDLFSLKKEETKRLFMGHGIKSEATEITTVDGDTEERLSLKLRSYRVGVEWDDIHPSKRSE